jgi:hypothetical protein
MTIKVNNAGTWSLVNNVYINQAGAWTAVQKVHYNNAGVWTEVYAAEVVATVTANAVNLNVQNLFTAGDWASTKKKRVVINNGVTIYSHTPATAALLTGTGRGGLLQIDNNGEIQGAGGLPNSGSGGHAIHVQQTGCTINNYWGIRGGGGAGGIGGTGGVGGTGVYTAVEGPVYQTSSPMYYWYKYTSNGGRGTSVYWAGTRVYSSNDPFTGGVAVGGITYLNTALHHHDEGSTNGSYPTWYNSDYYYIQRSYPVYVGGAGGGGGGNGGYGQGGNVARSNGLGGAGGGNAGGNSGVGGTGGTGGNGGTWGTAGNAGNPGATGNAGNAGGGGGGYAGGGGGAAGYAIIGEARTVNNFNTINGTNG